MQQQELIIGQGGNFGDLTNSITAQKMASPRAQAQILNTIAG